MRTGRSLAAAGLIALVTRSAPVQAQSGYRDTDAGRPLRVEDAVATERYALGAHLAPLRAERAVGGRYRWRAEPELSYGILPRTEIELRAPLVYIDNGAASRAGLSGVGVAALHALTLETPGVPALAVAGEVVLPAGSLAAPRATYSAKAIATRTFRVARVHVNAGVGTWNVAAAATQSCPRLVPPGVQNPCASGPALPFVPDLPCSVAPLDADGAGAMSRLCGMSEPDAVTAPTDTTPTHGHRWLLGLAADHAFALHSVLVGADVYAERFRGLYARPDWAAEIGVRRQWSPRLVIDAGLTRRFAGSNPATLGTLGGSLTMATRALQRGR